MQSPNWGAQQPMQMQPMQPPPQQHQQQQVPPGGSAPWLAPAAQGGAPSAVGNVIGQHKGRLELRDIMPMGGVLLIGLGIAAAAVTIPEIIAGTQGVSSLSMVPILLALGALCIWRTVRQMKQTLDVCERGFVYRIGGKEQTVPWTEVTGHRGIRVLGPQGQEKGFRLVLALRDGKNITLTTWLTNVHGLYTHVSSIVPPF